MKNLIVTGDDFGLSTPVNDAIIKAHEKGILTTSSLMVSAPAAQDAVKRAKKLPELNVGMHLVLSHGKPILPASELTKLVDNNGNFKSNLVCSGIKMFFGAEEKYQLEKEIRAQFEAFKATGLSLDHVNAHKHIHLHPTVFDLILTIGSEYGLSAIRIPDEPLLDSIIDSNKDKLKRILTRLLFKPFIASMKKKCRIRNIKFNQTIYGLYDSGHMTIDKLVRIIPHITEGLTEIYLHPATEPWDGIDPVTAGYEFEAEYKALIHARTKRAIEKFDIELTGFNA